MLAMLAQSESWVQDKENLGDLGDYRSKKQFVIWSWRNDDK